MSERLYKENKIYQATVTGQLLTTSKSGDPQFRLEVELAGILKNKTVEEGVEELSDDLKASKVIFFTFNPEPSRMARCFRDLAIIGLNSMDIGLLDPDNAKGLKLIGKSVLVLGRPAGQSNGLCPLGGGFAHGHGVASAVGARIQSCATCDHCL